MSLSGKIGEFIVNNQYLIIAIIIIATLLIVIFYKNSKRRKQLIEINKKMDSLKEALDSLNKEDNVETNSSDSSEIENLQEENDKIADETKSTDVASSEEDKNFEADRDVGTKIDKGVEVDEENLDINLSNKSTSEGDYNKKVKLDRGKTISIIIDDNNLSVAQIGIEIEDKPFAKNFFDELDNYKGESNRKNNKENNKIEEEKRIEESKAKEDCELKAREEIDDIQAKNQKYKNPHMEPVESLIKDNFVENYSNVKKDCNYQNGDNRNYQRDVKEELEEIFEPMRLESEARRRENIVIQFKDREWSTDKGGRTYTEEELKKQIR